MSDVLRLTEKETQAVDLILEDDFSDPIQLVERMGYNKATFFQYGIFGYLDLRGSDLTGVSFEGARLGHVVLRPDQVSTLKATEPVLEKSLDVRKVTPPAGSGTRRATVISEYNKKRRSLHSLDIDSIVAYIQEYNPNTDSSLIYKAYNYAQEMHEGQLRHSGEPYLNHPVSVAAILIEERFDDSTIIAALLHDTIENTRATYENISEIFGHEVANLVDGVTKLTNLQLISTGSRQGENFRKLFLAMSKDLRVLLIKLADRLHNMRTIKSMRPEKQMQKARETMKIYAPLARRLGLRWMCEELEDLAFHILNTEGRASIIRRFITLQRETGDIVARILDEIRVEMKRVGLEVTVFGRAKKPYSIWRKMEEQGVPFKGITDIYGFRIITSTKDECYRALDAVHQRWSPVNEHFEDHIAQPRSNGYRSIDTAVTSGEGIRFEIQIRTEDMHQVSEAGHTESLSFRNGVQSQNPFATDPSEWLSTLAERLYDNENRDEVFEHVRLEMYSDQVFCFTPNGDVVKLVRGATPIDFAYAIHTQVGHHCVGTKADGVRVPLWTRLKNGQSVEIITAEGQSPQETWLDVAQTSRARSAIRRALQLKLPEPSVV